MEQTSSSDLIRNFLVWLFARPDTAYFSMNVAIDFHNALDYLEQVNTKDQRTKVTINHLVAASIGRTLARFPDANARLIRRQIVQQPTVNMAMPINLIGHTASKSRLRDLSLGLVKDVDTRSLRHIAVAASKMVKSERAGTLTHPLTRRLWALLNGLPPPMLHRMLDVINARYNGRFAAQVYDMFPMTTAMTNPGAALGDVPGAAFRGASFNLPNKLGHVGTLWGISALQEDVLAVDGKPTVRTVLPVICVTDHRLIDGHRASKMLATLIAVLQEPEHHFGPTGDKGV